MSARHLMEKYHYYVTFCIEGGPAPFRFCKADNLIELHGGLICDYVRRFKQKVRYRDDEDWKLHVVFSAFGSGKLFLSVDFSTAI